MNEIWKSIRHQIRNFYRILNGLNGFIYDFKRFLYFGGWHENLTDKEVRNYNSVMAYHGLEKSLSYSNRNPTSGWSNAERVFLRLEVANSTGDFGYHDKAAKQVLYKFLNLPENIKLSRAIKMLGALKTMNFESVEVHGAIEHPLENYQRAKLSSPEDFFFTRYSLREFNETPVPDQIIERAVKLAMKTPSVCNRQAWHIYHSTDRNIIDKTLSYQNGNKPFGNKIPNLFVITTDLKAFFAGSEHYQHWIDGGLFSMSIIYALHSLGIASCPLNWSQIPQRDRDLRKAIHIKPNQTVIMMIAVGYPAQSNTVCSSTRRPINEVLSDLKLK